MKMSNGDSHSISILKNSISEFSKTSSLLPNLNKSFVYFSGLNGNMINDIKICMGFKEGILSVKYLGLPLMTSKLSKVICNEFINRIVARISSWTSKSAFLFVLSKSMINGVEKKCRIYLWHGNKVKRGSPISWSTVYSSKRGGELSVKAVFMWNVAAVAENVWNVITFQPSLWAKWVIINKFRLSSFWGIAKPLGSSWS
ncbi:uncharacterized protein LOC126668242 [Mercurialis annua]|uniref:uncharacterized protein LOC126668242 n=1 Tax=Mercurialis annua TaxID=3986 RepID=UPI00215F85DB|nr:uncharacterized protein LOC126668242 [Mercurialis annua]